MKTYFASPERASEDVLRKDILLISSNPVIDGLLNIVSGLLAVVNTERQIVALNETLLKTLGVGEAEDLLGLRYGEAISCIHASETPGGCGTSRHCASCGAAIAQVVSLSENHPVEKSCAVTISKEGKTDNLFFKIRSCPITIERRDFLLLFIQDMTHYQRLAALERVFFHDVSNIISGLLNASELLLRQKENAAGDLATYVHKLSVRLANELAMQRCLSQTQSHVYRPTIRPVLLTDIFKDIEAFFSHHPVAEKKLLSLPGKIPHVALNTDPSLLMRVLGNMIINAFEESQVNDEVKVFAELSDHRITFGVWNRKPIPESIAGRIFQRNISTKAEMGRGLGTYAMKLFGEGVLGGKVDFTTSETGGTLFRFCTSL